MTQRIEWARSLAQQHLTGLGCLWAHMQAVAATAARLPFAGDDHE